MKIKVICDSTAALTEEFVQGNNIQIVSLNVIIDGTSYKDGIDIELYEVMDQFYAGSKVSSSQPSPNEFVQAFLKAKEEGYTDVLCFTISSTLSGTYNSAKLASEEVSGIQIHVVDTLSCSIGEEIVIHRGVEYLKNNSLDSTLEYIEMIKKNSVILMNMENLTALNKSGRITRIKAALGNLIRVKPILEYIGGKLSVISKFRTENAVNAYILERIAHEIQKVKTKFTIYLSHVRSLDKIIRLKDLIEEKFKSVKVHISKETSPVVAVNIGYGGLGIAWCYE